MNEIKRLRHFRSAKSYLSTLQFIPEAFAFAEIILSV
jgi:hypothetical protein